MRPYPETPGGRVADRAVAVPFEAEPLLGARVRVDPNHGKTALLHDFSGTGATYTVPWEQLPACIHLPPFDAALHAEVAALSACTPSAIRRALAAASTPELATPERVAAMRRVAAIEEDFRVELALAVISQLLRPLSARLEDLDSLVYGPARVRSGVALRDACARHGISADRFGDIHGELVSDLLLVGLPGPSGQASGWLRLLTDELARLSRTLQRRLQISADAGDPLRRIMSAATGTVAGAAVPLSSIDELARDLWRVFARWDEIRPRLRGIVTELDWRLDGWPQILQAIADAGCAVGDERRAILAKAALIAEALRRQE